METKLSYDRSSLEILPGTELVWGDAETRKLTADIFDAAGFPTGGPSPRSVRATLKQRSEGLSDARVYELTFSFNNAGREYVHRFILRAHIGDGAIAAATKECTELRRLGKLGVDCLSCSLVDWTFSIPGAVVIRHAADEAGVPLRSLDEVARDALSSDGDTERLARNLEGFVTRVGNIFDEGTQSQTADLKDILGRMAGRLCPDVVIDARTTDENLAAFVDERRILVIPDRHSGALPPRTYPSMDIAALRDDLIVRPPGERAEWVEVHATPTMPRGKSHEILTFAAGDARLWVRLPDALAMQLRGSPPRGVVLPRQSGVVSSGMQALEDIGYPSDACLSSSMLTELFAGVGANPTRSVVLEVLRHNDMHCRNVQATPDTAKLIDFGEPRAGLLGTDRARLEVDLWARVAGVSPITEAEAAAILEHVHEKRPLSVDLGPTARHFLRIVAAVRGEPAYPHWVSPEQRAVNDALAYVIEVLLYQRYRLEREERPGPMLATATRYFLDRLRRLVDGEALDDSAIDEAPPPPPTAPVRSASRSPNVDPDRSVDSVAMSTASGEPTLYDLWRESLLKFEGQGQRLFADQERLLGTITQRDPVRMRSPLTALQRAALQAALKEQLFSSDRHVVIGGPTSTGKSTIADMFLASTASTRGQRFSSLYIAPTRALAQAKFRELQALLAGLPKPLSIRESIVLSTGEDTDFDWNLAHGEFLIACLVYEKANILFSQNTKLLNRLGCVVIDEIHMLSDLDRGPMLEMVLTKAAKQRREDDGKQKQGPTHERMRIIAITTEDTPDQAFLDFLSVADRNDVEKVMPPIVVHDTNRPQPVEHVLVLPPSTDDSKFTVCPIAVVRGSDERTLAPDVLFELSQRITECMDRIAKVRSSMAITDPVQERRTRTQDFLRNRIEQDPKGRRTIVFVPSKLLIEQLAQWLRRNLDRTLAVAPEFLQSLDSLEDPDDAALLKSYAEKGIFLHHADIHRTVRRAIEGLSADRVGDAEPSQILLATETLSYGVNLAIDDVVLMSMEFPSATRFGVPTWASLSLPAFHNMTGRGGRLGKVRADRRTSVFIMVANDAKPFEQIIEQYYVRIAPVRSQLFVVDDKKPFLEQRFNVFAKKDLGATDFSYPFVRSVLDALRYMKLVGESETQRAVSVKQSVDNVISLLGGTLYAKQFLIDRTASATGIELLRQAVEVVLHGCAHPSLDLVEETGSAQKLYSIKARGEAIIDTGTEIATIAPLMDFVNRMHAIWTEVEGNARFPNDLYVLCVIAQEEVYRSFIRSAPECQDQSRRNWTAAMVETNRRDVLEKFTATLRELPGIRNPAELGTKLRDLLESVTRIDAAYPNGAADSLMRFFNATLKWINGAELNNVLRHLDGRAEPRGRSYEPPTATARISWRQFTEQLGWKTIFLRQMLATRTDRETIKVVTTSEDLRTLHQLSVRLRLGCAPDSIPLFWPRAARIERRDANQLIRAHLTPSRILAASARTPSPSGLKGTAEKLDDLREGLGNYAGKQFEELAEEMQDHGAATQRRSLAHAFWSELKECFSDSVEEFRNLGGKNVKFDEKLRMLDFSQIDAEREAGPDSEVTLRMRSAVPGPGLSCEVTRPRSRGPEVRPARVLGVQVRRDWSASAGNPWRKLAAQIEAQNDPHLVLVVLPWLPDDPPSEVAAALKRRLQLGQTTTFMSPGAFGLLVSVVVRAFVTGDAAGRLLRLLDDIRGAAPLSVRGTTVGWVGVREVQRAIDEGNRQMPAPILDRLLLHFEVRPFD